MQAKHSHYCEGLARLDPGPGFFRPDSRPARDCGVLLLRWLAGQKAAAEPLAVLDGLAGCGIRALRYGLEAQATEIWANDADPDRLPLLQRNLGALGGARSSAITIQKLLAQCAAVEQRFDFVDLDAFGAPMALVPWALEAVRFLSLIHI